MAKNEQTVCDKVKWIDITAPTQAEMEEVSKTYGLHYELVRDCMEPDHLPKYELADEVNFLIIRYFSHSFYKTMGTIQELSNKIAIFYTEDFLITIHKESIGFLEDLREKYVHKGKCNDSADVVSHILWYTLDTFDAPAQQLSEEVDELENNVLLKKILKSQLQGLYFIKRQAALTIKIMVLMAEPINHIHAQHKDKPSLQDVRDKHLKVLTLYSQVHEESNNLMNLYMSFATQKTNDVMKVLTIFSVFFMPLTFVVGIYGMNFRYMPELDEPWAYPAVMVLMVLITVVIFIWFRRKGWL